MRSEVEGRGTARHGNAGEVRQGSEAKGRDGRVEVRQVRYGEEGWVRSGGVRKSRGRQGMMCSGWRGKDEIGKEWQEWSGEFVVARSGLARQAAKGAIRKGGTGGARTGMAGTV